MGPRSDVSRISGRRSNAAPGLDLEYDAHVAAANCGQLLVERLNVLRGIHKRVADQVRVLGHEAQILQVAAGQGGQAKLGIGKVDSLIGAEPRAARRRVRDGHCQAFERRLADDATNLAVVEPDRLTCANVREYRGQSATHGCRPIARGAFAKALHAGEHQEIACSQSKPSGLFRQVAHSCDALGPAEFGATLASNPQTHACREISSLLNLGGEAVRIGRGYAKPPFGPAGIAKFDAVPGL